MADVVGDRGIFDDAGDEKNKKRSKTKKIRGGIQKPGKNYSKSASSAMNKAENAERQRRAEEQRRIQAQKRAEEERRRQMRQQQQPASSYTYTPQTQYQPPKRKSFWQRLKDFFSGN